MFSINKNGITTIMCGDKEYYIESEQKEVYESIYLKHFEDAIYIILPQFDSLLLAYYDKSWIIEQQFIRRVWRVAGQVEGVVLQHGRAITT